MVKTFLVFCFLAVGTAFAHEMQHGFIISDDDRFFSHLVAQGHHSHQLDASGTLIIPSREEREIYRQHKELNVPLKKTYFLFQAQKLNLPSVKGGQVLTGHIIESPVGDYQPQNIIIRDARIQVDRVFINMVNPFYVND
ncbi:hypothetical protein ACJVC5_19460 [Peredibacter sp. HCB2-198]|uniref:hypothetical protein n=1 Tax=Peredibacter sp. HCB2-198 TaxID=3383025 RepID=UPI0038B5A8C9